MQVGGTNAGGSNSKKRTCGLAKFGNHNCSGTLANRNCKQAETDKHIQARFPSICSGSMTKLWTMRNGLLWPCAGCGSHIQQEARCRRPRNAEKLERKKGVVALARVHVIHVFHCDGVCGSGISHTNLE